MRDHGKDSLQILTHRHRLDRSEPYGRAGLMGLCTLNPADFTSSKPSVSGLLRMLSRVCTNL